MYGELRRDRLGYSRLHAFVQLQDRPSLPGILPRLFCDRRQKEQDPIVPLTRFGDLVELLVIRLAMSFQISAQIEHGGGKHSVAVQDQREGHATDTSVTIIKQLQDFELGVDDGHLYQSILILVMNVVFPVVDLRWQRDWVGRDKYLRFYANAGRTDPVLHIA